jgi:cytochrome c oxidase subunit II
MSFRIEPHDRPHATRLAITWIVLSIIAVIAVLQIHYPPYDNSVQGSDQSRTLQLLTAIAAPVFVGVVMMLVYSAIFFRRRTTELIDGPPMLGNTPIQTTWIVVSAALVLFLALVGITTLASSNIGKYIGAGGRALNAEAATGGAPGNEATEIEVQVIAQQWYFTYRFPQYGGVETTHLELPVNRGVDFHVTSLDVVHSFWAYELGVKADANQGVDNEFHVTPTKTGTFTIRCAELCGLWHGNMSDTNGQVVSQSDFDSWIAQQQQDNAEITKALPSYAPYYFPLPLTKGS